MKFHTRVPWLPVLEDESFGADHELVEIGAEALDIRVAADVANQSDSVAEWCSKCDHKPESCVWSECQICRPLSILNGNFNLETPEHLLIWQPETMLAQINIPIMFLTRMYITARKHREKAGGHERLG